MPASMSFLVVEGNFVYFNLLLQITILSLAAIVLCWRFRHNAVVRYSLLYSSLLSLVLLCVVSVFLQSRSAGFLRINIATPAAYLEHLLVQSDQAAQILFELDVPSESLHTTLSSAPAATTRSLALLSTVLAWPIFKLPLITLLQVIWLFGFFIATFGLLRSLHNADRIARRSSKLRAGEYRLFNSMMMQHRLGVSGLHCRRSLDIQAPVLVGIASPILLVPEQFFERFEESDIRAVLRHEVAHVLRKDPISNFLQKLILSLFWFHPLVHHMDKMISRAREEICDNYVLSEEQAVGYGEALLRLNMAQLSISSDADRAFQPNVGLGVFSENWNLEQRISDLLNQNREILMHLSQRSKVILNVAVVAAALTISACQLAAQDDTNQARVVDVVTQTLTQAGGGDVTAEQVNENENENENRSEREQQTLGPWITEAISQIQELMKPTTDAEPDMELAKERLDTLYEERYERMNDFEKQTLLNFYTNYYLSLADYIEATNTFEQMLTLENLREDIRLRVLRSLGQLHAALENWDESIDYYELWQAASDQTDHVALQGLSYANYQLEQFGDALDHWLAYMDLQREEGAEFSRENYSYLNGLYFTLEQWDNSLETTKEMILLYNSPTDWENLRAIYRKLDEQDTVSQDAGAA